LERQRSHVSTPYVEKHIQFFADRVRIELGFERRNPGSCALDPRLQRGAVIQRAGGFNVLRDLAESARLENVCVLLHAEQFVLA
jgi:hypothetical protein